jgi:DNA polymerase V
VTLYANHVIKEQDIRTHQEYEQMDLFTDYEAKEKVLEAQNQALEREKKMQQAVLSIKKKYGKNAILKGMNLQEGATTVDRNNQIGGHRA